MNRTCCWLVLWVVMPSWSTTNAATPSLSQQISPLLYKLGCSAGECHGSFSGKGNFRLSLFAADVELDYRELHGGFERRLDRLRPEQSLLLRKPTAQMPHGGGKRLDLNSPEYQLLHAWISAGAPADPSDTPQIVSVRAEPATIVARPHTSPVGIRARAQLSDGRELDVTPYARFESLDTSLVEVARTGQVTTLRPGDTYVLVHYCGQIGYLAVLAPGPALTGEFPNDITPDPIDRAVHEKLRRLNIVPSDIVGDHDFLRRVYLDVIGRLPTADEVRAFVAERSLTKRQQVIDRLLCDPLHAAVWANKLCDAMGADNRTMYDESVYRIYDWMRNRFERNVPWDEIVRGALTGTIIDGRSLDELRAENERLAERRKLQNELQKSGQQLGDEKLSQLPWHTTLAHRNTLEDFSYNLKFRVQAGPRKGRMDPRPLAQHVATAFLGVRLECAECHKHPHDRWSQQDFFSFTSCFAYLDRGLSQAMRDQKLIYINGTYVTAEPQETFPDPKTGEPLPPRPLDGPVIDVQPGIDPRLEVWRWMVAAENPYFARAIVNRIWAHYFGRGLIDPIDALAAANPPSHPEILDDLVRDLRAHDFDLRHVHRRLLNTTTYQRDWATNASNHADERNYSHRVLRRMPAELMLDAINDVTGAKLVMDLGVYGGPKDDRSIPRAIEMPLSRPRGDDSYVLKIFDKPQRTQSCDCERSSAPNLSQALFFYNDTALVAKITAPTGRLARWLDNLTDDQRLLEELYLTTLGRWPTASERELSHQHLRSSKSRREGFEDLFWSLLNRQEYLIMH